MKKADAQPKIEKKKKSHKKLYIALGIVAIIVIVLLVMFVLPLISKSEPAVLIIDKGSVEINHGSGWSPAASGIALRANDAVRTLTDSQASIIFFGSSAVRLDQNTEVKISELLADKENTKVSLNQESGRIWNKVTKLSGFEDYSIETPTAVATVRGTGFDSKVTGKDSDITLIEGKLAVDSIKKEDGKKTIVSSIELNENEAAKVEEKALDKIQKSAAVEDDWIKGNKQKDSKFLEDIKQKLRSKYATYISIAKAQYGLTDADLDKYFDEYMAGKISSEQINDALKKAGIELSV